MKQRLDILIFQKGLVSSRKIASDLIKEGKVLVNKEKISKPSKEIDEVSEIEITEQPKYVSRAGLKLEHAIKEFGVDVSNKTILDCGASTGGFTDFLLQNGAKKIFAVDVGTNQLHEKVKNNSKVVSLEKTDIREIKSLPEKIDLTVVDVSFISLTNILEKLKELTKEGGEIVTLVKPQFELEKSKLNKKGIVKSEEYQKEALGKIKDYAKEIGLKVMNETISPILGGDGNLEYFLYLKK